MLQPPRHPTFELADGCEPVQQILVSIAAQDVQKLINCPECNLPNLDGERRHFADERRRRVYQLAVDKQTRVFVRDLIAQWPTADISTPTGTNLNTYIRVPQAMENARLYFQSWYRNLQFQGYIQQVQAVLDSMNNGCRHVQRYSFLMPIDRYTFRRPFVNFENLTSTGTPRLPISDSGHCEEWITRGKEQRGDQAKLKELLATISSHCSSRHEQQYADDLVKSMKALCEDSFVELKDVRGLRLLLGAHLMQAQQYKDVVY